MNRRRAFGHEVASVLYGVIALMSADLVYKPGMITRYAAAGGAILVGLAMALTHASCKWWKAKPDAVPR